MKRYGVILCLVTLAAAGLPAVEAPGQSVQQQPKPAVPSDDLAASTLEAALKSTEETGALSTEKLLESAELMSRIPEEERREFYRLYRENPARFRTALVERLRQMRAEEERRLNDIRQLVVSYHAFADDAARRKMIRDVLFAAIRTEFDRKLVENRRRLDELEMQLKELRKEYRFREKNAAAIVEAKVCRLLGEEPTEAQASLEKESD